MERLPKFRAWVDDTLGGSQWLACPTAYTANLAEELAAVLNGRTPDHRLFEVLGHVDPVLSDMGGGRLLAWTDDPALKAKRGGPYTPAKGAKARDGESSDADTDRHEDEDEDGLTPSDAASDEGDEEDEDGELEDSDATPTRKQKGTKDELAPSLFKRMFKRTAGAQEGAPAKKSAKGLDALRDRYLARLVSGAKAEQPLDLVQTAKPRAASRWQR